MRWPFCETRYLAGPTELNMEPKEVSDMMARAAQTGLAS